MTESRKDLIFIVIVALFLFLTLGNLLLFLCFWIKENILTNNKDNLCKQLILKSNKIDSSILKKCEYLFDK